MLDELGDRLELAVAELGLIVRGQAAEEVEGGGLDGGGGLRHERVTLGGAPKRAEPGPARAAPAPTPRGAFRPGGITEAEMPRLLRSTLTMYD